MYSIALYVPHYNKEDNSSKKNIIILGGGFAGIQVFKKLQKKFRHNKSVNITLVSRDNFILFTPMLHEVSSDMIEIRHIVTPIRAFLQKANFYEADIQSIDLNEKKVTVTHAIGRLSEPTEWDKHVLEYDYLVIAMGGETSFFEMEDIRKHSFTMKTINDAIILRNHVINILEQANFELQNNELKQRLLTFVVVGGGFGGVETVGELNDFVKDTVRGFYKNIHAKDIKIILVNAHDKILPEVGDELGNFALQKLKERGVQFVMNTHAKGATDKSLSLDNGMVIPTYTLIWTAGVNPSKVVANLPCSHDKHHRIIANTYLELQGYERVVYALGDCASVSDPHTGKPYPPTAQHAIRQGKVAADNIIHDIEGKTTKKKKFDYNTRGMMAEIGRRSGVAKVFGFKVHGFLAWWLWRTFYLANLPTLRKKMKVMGDWTTDLLYRPDASMIKD